MVKRISPILLLGLTVIFISCSTNDTGQKANNNEGAQSNVPKGVADTENHQSLLALLRKGEFFSALDGFISQEVPGFNVKGVGEVIKAGNMTLFDLDLDSKQGRKNYYCVGRCLTDKEGKAYWIFVSVKDQSAGDFFEHVLQLEKGNSQHSDDKE